MTKLEELKQRHAELKGQILEESKAWFKESAQSIFDKYPTVESFSWTQYTPYFNDGEECTFSAHTDEPNINGEDGYEIATEMDWDKEPAVPKADQHPLNAAQCEIVKLLHELDGDTLKEMFGDHCEVTAKRDGITVEEYSHD